LEAFSSAVELGHPVKTVTVVLVLALLGFPNTGFSTEKKTVSPYRAESSAYMVQGKDAWTYVTENRSFRFAEVLDDAGNYETPLLLEETSPGVSHCESD
jgi:hypothetical protein